MTEKVRKDDGRGMNSRGRHRLDVPDSPFGERVQDWILHHSVRLIHGPARISYDVDELVVLVLLRNGLAYLDMFVDHYSSLSAKHIVFLDNGSTDGTVEALKGYENVTVLQTGLPYKRYNVAMKRYLIERFGRGRWTLSVDIDELFDYPYSDSVSLKSLLRYLSGNSHTAMVAYMLDMFPKEALSEESADNGVSLKRSHRFYDISEVRTQDYHDIGDIGNTLANEGVNILKGGVQKRNFNISPLLIKHPLVFLDEKIRPMDLSDHWAANARVADLTGVLLHYKISASLYGLVRREIEERRYISRGGKYDKYHDVLTEKPNLVLKTDTAKELKSVNDLVGSRFVAVSEDYLRFVADEERRNGVYSERDEKERLFRALVNAEEEKAAFGKNLGNQEQQIKAIRQEARAAARRARREKEDAVQEAQESRRSPGERSGDALTSVLGKTVRRFGALIKRLRGPK